MQAMKKILTGLLFLFLAACGFLLPAALCAQHTATPHESWESQPASRDTGPTSLLLLYRCAPENRVALRDYMLRKGLPQFHQWQRQGVFFNSKVLFSRYVDTNNWDMLVFLQFRTPADVAKWNGIERTSPAGLGNEALRLTTGISTYLLDQVAAEALETAAKKSVYFFIPYDYTVSTDAYLQYIHGYVVPQLSGWMRENALESYRMFIGRGVAGRSYSAILLLEYKNDEALGAREHVVNEVRESLKKNPAWKALSENKQSVRTEKAAVIADELK